MRAARAALVALGVLGLGIGAWALLAQVPPRFYVGILTWLAGALIIHDGIIAPLVAGLSLLARRAGRRVPYGAIATGQVVLVTGAIVTALVVPEALKKSMGTANPTVLPLEYAPALAVFVGVLAAIALVSIGAQIARARRPRAPRSAE